MKNTTESVKPEPTTFFRWTVLVFISLAMFGNYYIYDSISPLADLLASQLKFTDSDIGWLQGIYSIPNVFMVLIGGFMIDRIGTKKASLIFSSLCMIGAFFTVIKGDLLWMATGRLIFGLGAESLIVAVTTIIARWFKGKELSFAFGLNLTIARLGTFAALNSPSWAKSLYNSWENPLWLATLFGVISVLSVIIYFILDKAAERKYALPKEDEQDKVVLKDIFKFNISFWFITLLCVTFYSGIFPFMTFSTKFFIQEHFTELPQDIARSMGGFLTSMLILATMILTPLFGLLADKKGKRATMMIIGSIMLIPVYLLMNYVHVDSKISDNELSKIYPDTEIVLDFVSHKNEEISKNIANMKNLETEINKMINIAYDETKNLIDEKNLIGKMKLELKDNKIYVSKTEPASFIQSIFNGIGYFINMIIILFTYFPNLVIPMTIMGIAFSLIPAVMWPSVALIVDSSKLGTAYGLMTMIQNIGLAGFNLLIGAVNDLTGGYTAGMWIFSTLGFFGLFFAIMLKKNDKGKKGHGLENPKN
jgi:MFS family permease